MTDRDSFKMVIICKKLLYAVETMRSYMEEPPRKINEILHEIETCAAIVHGLSMKLSDNPEIQLCVPKVFKTAWEQMDEAVSEDDAKIIMKQVAEVFKDS